MAYGFTSKLSGGRLASGQSGGRHRFRESALLGWYITRNWKRVMSKRREIMSRKRVDDDYIASWFRYEPVSAPAIKSKTSARAMARSKAARG